MRRPCMSVASAISGSPTSNWTNCAHASATVHRCSGCGWPSTRSRKSFLCSMWVDGQPQPEHLCTVAEACAQFVQLEVGEPEMAEATLMQHLRMLPSASKPLRDGGLSVVEDPFGRGRVQPFGQCGQ